MVSIHQTSSFLRFCYNPFHVAQNNACSSGFKLCSRLTESTDSKINYFPVTYKIFIEKKQLLNMQVCTLQKTELKLQFCSRCLSSFLKNVAVHNMKSVMMAVPGGRVSRYRAVKIYSFGLFIWVYLVSLVQKEHEREANIRTGNRGTVEPPLRAISLQRPLSSVNRLALWGGLTAV